MTQKPSELLWPLLTGFLRVMVAIGGGWIALRLTGSLNWRFAALALGLIVYGVVLTAARHFLRIKGHTAIQIT